MKKKSFVILFAIGNMLIIEAQEKNQKLINDQEALKEEIENFKTPDIYESRVISRFADDNKFASFAQLVTRIQKGTATQPDIEQYIKLKNSINPDILEKNILKNRRCNCLYIF